jgi:hypothetical protein
MRLLCSLFFVGIVAVGLAAAPVLPVMASSPLAGEQDASSEEREEQEVRQPNSRRAQSVKKKPCSGTSLLRSPLSLSRHAPLTEFALRPQASFHPPALKLLQVFRI